MLKSFLQRNHKKINQKTWISHSYLKRQSFKGYFRKSYIAIFAWRVLKSDNGFFSGVHTATLILVQSCQSKNENILSCRVDCSYRSIMKSNQLESNQIKSNQIKANQINLIKSNQIKSNQTKGNQTKPNQTKSNQTKSNPIQLLLLILWLVTQTRIV